MDEPDNKSMNPINFPTNTKKDLLYCTTSVDKFELGKAMCQKYGINLIQQPAEVDEIQTEDAVELVTKKAQAIYTNVKKPMIISDDSWEIPELNGFPGPYMKSVNAWFGVGGWMKVSKTLTDKRIFLRSYVVYIDEHNFKIFTDSQERVFIENPSKTEHPAAILRCVTIPGESESVADIKNVAPEKLLKGRELWDNLATWYNDYIERPAK